MLKWLISASLLLSAPAWAQGTGRTSSGTPTSGVRSSTPYYTNGQHGPVATQPSNNPFQNPIGQGVPPAASANSTQNSRQTMPLR